MLPKSVESFDHTSMEDHISKNIKAAQVGLDIFFKKDTKLGRQRRREDTRIVVGRR